MKLLTRSTTGLLEAPTGREEGQAAPKEALRPNLQKINTGEREAQDGAARPARAAKLSTARRLELTATFARHMQVMVGTGIPIAAALHAAVKQASRPIYRQHLQRIADDVDEGLPLSSAMAGSDLFDTVSVVLVAAGESSGNMAVMLERLADLKRRQLRMRATIVAALIYPAMLTTMGICVLLMMLLFVIPRFSLLFSSLDSPLPITTKVLLMASSGLMNHWIEVLVGVGMAAGALWYAVRTGLGRATFDRRYLDLPLIGPLGRSLLSARIARMLGTLLESKVPLTESLELTRRGAVNELYIRLIGRAEQAVARGAPLSSVLEESDLLVPGVQEALRNGESTGRMGQPLLQMAQFLDEENDAALKSLTTVIEPVILIALGLMVGLIAMSIFLPMFDMISAAQGGA